MTKRKDRTTRGLALGPREKLVDDIMRHLSQKKIRSLVEWSLEVNDAAQEYRVGEAEGMPQFIRRLGEAMRESCRQAGHGFDPGDPRCLRCGAINADYIPPAGPDESLPTSREVH